MPTLRRLGWTLAAAPLLLISASSTGPLPPIGPFLDPVSGVWSAAHQTRASGADLPLSGLQAPVEVLTDQRGVPHIFAATDLDAWRALGRLHVRDRLFQLELQSRATEGTLTEWVGATALPLDRQMRQLGLARRADSLWRALDSTSLQYRALAAYADGVNSGIAALGPRDLPFEYHLLNVRPRKWRPEYTLYLAFRMAYTLAWQNNDLEREALATLVGEGAAADLFPAESPIQVPVVPGPKEAGGSLPFRLRAPAVGRRPPRAPVNLATAAYEDLLAGSNNWVVGPRRTAGHHALLAGDPHLDLTLPSVWYEAHLVSQDGMDVYGVTIPGEPAVIIGLTPGVAWSFTNAEADFVDHYREVVDDDRAPTRYRVDGQWYPVATRVEAYRDPRGRIVATDTLLSTRRGPLLPYAGGWRSLRWTVLETRDPIGTFLGLQRIRSVGDWLEVVGRLESPSQNGVAADTAGHIAERTGGRFPRRPGNDGGRIFDGARSGEDWQGDLPALAGVVDPPRSFLFSANQQIVDPRSDAAYRGAGWAAPWRALRIQHLLAADSAVTLDAMRRWQTDPVSERAEWWRGTIVAASSGDEALAVPHALLAGWREGYLPASRGAALFEATMDAVATLTWDELNAGDGRRVADPSVAVLAALRDRPDDIWWDRVATAQRERRDDILRLAVARAWRQLSDPTSLGPDTTAWRWDRYRTAQIPHLAFLPGLGASGLSVTGGNGTLSPLGSGGSHGASWRMVVEMGPRPTVLATYPGGQSGNPASARYDDRVEGWRVGALDTVRLPRAPAELAAQDVIERFRFVPGMTAPPVAWPSTWWLVAAIGLLWGIGASRIRCSPWWGVVLGAGVWGSLLLLTWEPGSSWRLATRLGALTGGGPAVAPILLTIGWAALLAGVVARAVVDYFPASSTTIKMRIIATAAVLTSLLALAGCGEEGGGPRPSTLWIRNGGQGAGTVSTADGAIQCALPTPTSSCSFSLPDGDVPRTFIATAATGSTFFTWGTISSPDSAGWTTLCVINTSNPCQEARVPDAAVVQPIFDLPNALTVFVFGVGRVTGTAGMDCRGEFPYGATACRQTYGLGTTATMSQSVGVFRGWDLACEGIGGSACTLATDSVHSLHAYFGDNYPPGASRR